jgi:putative transcriptional regulator
MSRKQKERDIGKEILEGIEQIKAGEVGRISHFPPIAEIREGVGLSQSEFAKLLGVSVRTLQEWEQGRRMPSGPARTLLAIAHKNPRALLDVAV